MKPKILHIHSDFPDGRVGYYTTKAVSNLIDASDDFDHYVVSINRTSNPFKISVKEFNSGISVVYWCIPFSIFYWIGIKLLCKVVTSRVKDLDYDLVHGHKITTDGLVARHLADFKSKPYCLSVRGGSDTRNISRFNYLKKTFARLFSNASFIFWVSPWARSKVCQQLGVQANKEANLPNPCLLPKSKPWIGPKEPKFFTVLSYHQYKRKSVLEVLKAVAILVESGSPVSLDIYGGGDDHVHALIKREISTLNLQFRVVIKGQVPHASLLKAMPEYMALVLPATNETFGMVYLEALASKVPYIAHANTGVDGFLRGDYAVYINSQQPEQIAIAMLKIFNNRDVIDAAINQLHSSGELQKFSQQGVVANYTSILSGILNAQH